MNTHHRNLSVALSLCAAAAVPTVASAMGISGQGTWETTLQGRDLDGNLATAEAYYDTVLNITWLADANAGAGSEYDALAEYPEDGSPTDGLMDWGPANRWASSLDRDGLAGPDGWRLPYTRPIDGTTADDDESTSYIGTEDSGYNVSAPGTLYAGSTASELAHMYYNTLGNRSRCDPIASTVDNCVDQADYGLTNSGPFANLPPTLYGGYWSATACDPCVDHGWALFTFTGYQDGTWTFNQQYAWAVHDGDVGVDCTSHNCGAVSTASIDIKPGSGTNAVNPDSSGKLKVAILASEAFDTSTVDVGTVRFGPDAAAPVWHRLDDVDDDGDWDLVMKFDIQATGIACGDAEATLSGALFGGTRVTGTDLVKTVGC
jgi:hypothetical protein